MDQVLRDQAEAILQEECTRGGVSMDKLLGNEKDTYTAFYRRTAMYRCRLELGMGTTAIGALFNRSRATVHSALDRCKNMKGEIAPTRTHWTDEEDQTIRRGLERGLSRGQIAELIPNRTRNAVIGRIARQFHLVPRRQVEPPKPVAKPKPPPRPKSGTMCITDDCNNNRVTFRGLCSVCDQRRIRKAMPVRSGQFASLTTVSGSSMEW